jgi:chromosome segregation ATPase
MELDLSRRSLRDERAELLAKIDNLEQANAAHVRTADDLSRANAQLQGQVSSFLSFISLRANRQLPDLSSARSLFAEYAATADAKSEKLALAEDECERLRQQLAASDGRLKDTKSKIRRIRKEAQRAAARPDAERSAEADKHRREIEGLQKTIGQQQGRITSLEESLKKARELHSAMPTAAPGPRDDLQARAAAYEARIASLEGEIASIRRELQARQEDVGRLKTQNDQLNDAVGRAAGELEAMRGLLRHSQERGERARSKAEARKEALRSLATDAGARDADLARCKTRISELELEVGMLREQEVQTVTVDQAELERLKVELKAKQKVIESFEGFLAMQSGDIDRLEDARIQFLSRLTRISDFLEGTEEYVAEVKNERDEMEKAMEAQAQRWADARQQETKEFFRVVEDLREKVPDDIAQRWPRAGSGSFRAVLQISAGLLIDRIIALEEQPANDSDHALLEETKRRYDLMLGHLESAYRFLKATATSRAFGEEEPRTELIAECARIGAFLQGNPHFLPSISVFDPEALTDPRAICAEFLRHVNEDDLGESPFRELLLLFQCVAQVNAALVRDLQAQSAIIEKVETLTNQEEEQRKEIDQLLQRLGSYDVIQKDLTPVLSQYVPDPPSSFPELSERFIETFDGSQIDREAMLCQIGALRKHIRRLERKVQRQSARELKQRAKFCDEANELIDSLENDLIAREEEEQEARQVQAQKDRQIEALKDELAHQASTAAHDAKAHRKIERLQKENDDLKQSNDQLQADLADLTAAADALRGEVSELQDKLDAARQKLAVKREQLADYRTRLTDSEKRLSSVLQDVKHKNDELSTRYSTAMADLVSANTKLKAELSAKISDGQSFEKILRQARLDNAELLAKQRTDSLRIENLTRALESERDSSSARQGALASSLRAQCESALDALRGQVKSCEELLSTLLAKEFGVAVGPGDLNDLIRATEQAIRDRTADQAFIAECKRLQAACARPLGEELRRRDGELAELTQSLAVAERDRRELLSDVEAARKDAAQGKPEAAKWATWSRAILGQLLGARAATMPLDDVRCLLEEALLSSVGNRAMTFKISSLRDQKKLLTQPALNPRSGLLAVRQRTRKVDSVRPMIVIMLSLRKMRQIAGKMPMKFTFGSVREL